MYRSIEQDEKNRSAHASGQNQIIVAAGVYPDVSDGGESQGRSKTGEGETDKTGVLQAADVEPQAPASDLGPVAEPRPAPRQRLQDRSYRRRSALGAGSLLGQDQARKPRVRKPLPRQNGVAGGGPAYLWPGDN